MHILYICNKCPNIFSKKQNYKRHQDIHENIKKFKCTKCYKCFRQKTHLITHYKIHTNEKKFKCHECNISFIQKCHLEHHLQSVKCLYAVKLLLSLSK